MALTPAFVNPAGAGSDGHFWRYDHGTGKSVLSSPDELGFADVIDIVQDFGAEGNGIGLNDTRIQDALDSCSDGDSLYVPSGSFYIGDSSLVASSRVNIFGMGELVGDYGAADTAVAILQLATGSSVSGISITNSHATGGGSGLKMANGSRARGITVTGGFINGIEAVEVTDARIEQCTIGGVDLGLSAGATSINVFSSTDIWVTGNYIYDTEMGIYIASRETYGPPADRVFVLDNVIKGTRGIQVRIAPRNVVVARNLIEVTNAPVTTGAIRFGILAQTEATSLLIKDNLINIAADVASANETHGIILDDRVSRCLVEGNSVTGAQTDYAISLVTSAGLGDHTDILIRGNAIDGVGGYGILVGNASRVLVDGNRTRSCGDRHIGISATSSSVTVHGNRMDRGTGPDFYALQDMAVGTVVSDNIATGFSAGYGMVLGGSSSLVTQVVDGKFTVSVPIAMGGSTGPTWSVGTGAPNGVVTAAVGSLYTRLDGGSSTTLYVKESGSGNTGWQAK